MTTQIGDSYSRLRAELLSRTQMTGPARSRALTRLTDGWLTELAVESGLTVGGVELVAVGGYGRSELSPHSDLDLVLLHTSETPQDYAAMIAEQLWYPIWDSPVRLDHAVRSVGGARQLARVDLADLLGVLDIRHIAGDAELSSSVRRRVLGDWRADARSRLPDLLQLCRQRWDRSGDLAFATAGDLKNSRGGLRDMVVMRAVAASWVADCPHQGLEEARAELLTVRDALHTVTGRAGDRLQVQEQDAVAAALGLSDRDELLRMVSAIGRRVGQAVDLTWHRVRRALDEPLGRSGRPDRRPLAHDVVEQDGEAVLARTADPGRDATLPLRVAAAAAQAGIPVGPATLARLVKSCPPLPVPWPEAARSEFLRLLGSGRALIGVWESMDQVGLVSTLIPGWERLRSMPQRDPVHRFTVDRHLVETVAEAAGLIRQVARPDLLLIAALLHDIGKGTGGDHAVAGAELAGPLCRRFGLSEADMAVVVTLVARHLLLAETAPRRDPEDPATVALIADAVGDAGVLDLLEALTEADAMAAGPAAWTTWKAQQVATLAARTRAALGGWLPSVGDPAAVDPPADPAVADPPLDPAAAGDGVVVVRVDPAPGGLTIVVGAPDRVGLLADIAGALTAQRLTIRSATVRTEAGRAVQTWQVEPGFGEPPEAATVRALLTGALSPAGVASSAPAGTPSRPARPIRRPGAGPAAVSRAGFAPPEVTVIEGASEAATVLEIRAHDAAGLLQTAAGVVAASGFSVCTALVHTFGAEAVDVLYLQDRRGRPLGSAQAEQLAGRVRAALVVPEPAGRPG